MTDKELVEQRDKYIWEAGAILGFAEGVAAERKRILGLIERLTQDCVLGPDSMILKHAIEHPEPDAGGAK